MNKFFSELKRNLSSEITEVPVLFQQSYFPSLDGLRAISIILVLLFHILMSYKLDFNFHPLANLGVQFFFVLSGFLITTLLVKEKLKTGTISLKKFYIRRTLRILPVAYAYLILILILNWMLNLHLDYLFLFVSFLFVRNFFMNAQGVDHLSTHYWSLSVEEQFYIIFPLIIKRNIHVYISFLLSLLLISMVLDFYNPVHLVTDDNIRTGLSVILKLITQFQGIAIGSIFSILIFKRTLVFDNINNTLITMLLLVGTIVLTFYVEKLHNSIIILQCILFACIVTINLKPGTGLSFKFLNTKVMKWIGVLSYSLYIWQQPLTLNLNYLNKTTFMQQFENKLPMDLVISAISILILIAISYVSYYYYEKKFLILKDRFK